MVGVVGSPGIGKSRLVREVSAMAGAGDVDVFTAFCESHDNQVPFHAVARLLRAATGVEGLDAQAARIEYAPGFLTPTRMICCCSTTCWASPTRMLRCRPLIPMLVGGG